MKHTWVNYTSHFFEPH